MSRDGTGGGPSPFSSGVSGGLSLGVLAAAKVVSSRSKCPSFGKRLTRRNWLFYSHLRRVSGWGMALQLVCLILREWAPQSQAGRPHPTELFPGPGVPFGVVQSRFGPTPREPTRDPPPLRLHP